MLSSLQTKFGRSLKSKKLNVFGLFFLLAFFILVITKLSDTYVETIPLHIQYKNLPENNIITLDSIPIIDVTVSANGFKLLSYNFYNQYYKLDFKKNVIKNRDTYVWAANKRLYDIKNVLGKSVKIISVKPDTLLFPYGTLSVKRVPIMLKSKINFASGYDTLEGLTMQPDSVNIIGSQKEIDTINLVETKLLNLDNVNSDINSKLNLKFPDSSVRLKLSDSIIQVTSQVTKFTEGTFDVTVNMVNLPNNVEVNYFPKHIKVSYYLSLDDYNDVKATDFMIECDYADIQKSDKSFIKPKLIVKSNKIKSARMKQNKVEYIIK